VTRTRFLAILAVAALWALPLAAADKPKPKTDPADPVEKTAPKTDAPAKPATDDANDTIDVLHPNDAAAMKEHLGKEVAVEGQVSEAAWSASGKVMQIKFAEATDTKFMAAAFVKTRAALDKAFGGDLAKAIGGKRVRVIGKLEDYKGSPEIKIDKPEQLEILKEASAAGDVAKPSEPANPAAPAKPAPEKKK
jgi:hypothetical protein